METNGESLHGSRQDLIQSGTGTFKLESAQDKIPTASTC